MKIHPPKTQLTNWFHIQYPIVQTTDYFANTIGSFSTSFLKQIFLIGMCFGLLSFTPKSNDQLPNPRIQAGIAKLSGKIIDFHLKKGEENPTLTLYVPNPITAETGVFKTHLDVNGNFHFVVPIECNTTIGQLGASIFEDYTICIGLIPGEETKLEILYDEAGQIKAITGNRLEFTTNDLLNFGKTFGDFLDAHDNERFYTMTPKDFSRLAIEKLMKERLKRSINDSILSKKAKNCISNECKLKYLKGCLLSYRDYMLMNYRNFKTQKEPDDFTPQEPNISYYTFLKYFNLNDPQYLYNSTYPELLQTILLNNTLNIPVIKDMPIQNWIKKVKTIMSGLIGSDSGLFYEVLAANAYAKQFNDELKPLSDKQKENIRNYFKNKEITKILLRRNEEITKLAGEKKYFNLVINKTPAVSKEALMKTIISKYKGKAVLVDFWATWCSPCMDAMTEIRKVKSAMVGKEIAFVYITNVSSPRKLWEAKIKGIGGEQYYLTSKEWESLTDSLDINYVPTYLFYDKNGVLKNKVTSYPGTAEMKKMIDQLL